MKLYERELFLYRIVEGMFKYKLPTGLNIVYKPTFEAKFEAQKIYEQTLIDAGFEGFFDEKNLLNFILLTNLWTREEEKSLVDDIPKLIESTKVALFTDYFTDASRVRHKRELATLYNTFERLIERRHKFDWLTCAGIATNHKLCYLVEHCTFTEDGMPYNWEHISLLNFLSCLNEYTLDDSKIREVALNEPWQSIWRSSEKNASVFNTTPLCLTDEQRKLILWSLFYDNIHENPDCPAEEIIEDHDALDGWLIVQRRNKDKQSTKKLIDSKLTNDKIANADEIFVLANNNTEAQKIEDLNDRQAQSVKKQRLAFAKEKGEVAEQQLPDVKLKLQMQANKLYADSMKGNK